MPTVLLGNLAVVESFGEAQAVVHSGDEAPPAPANTVANRDIMASMSLTCGSIGSK